MLYNYYYMLSIKVLDLLTCEALEYGEKKKMRPVFYFPNSLIIMDGSLLAKQQKEVQIPDRAMPLSLSSFCPLLGMSTGVLCAKTEAKGNHVIGLFKEKVVLTSA